MDRKRWWFNLLAIATLIGFAIFCALVTAGAALVPSLRPDEDEGFRVERVWYSGVRFNEDDSRIEFEVRTDLRKSPTEAKTKTRVESVPTGRKGEAPRAMDFAKSNLVIRRLMAAASFDLAFGEALAISHDHREIAFICREAPGSVVRRAESNRYISMAGTPLPAWARKLEETRTGSVEERLGSPALDIWADAAIETILKKGALPAVHADRLLAARDKAPELRAIADVLLSHDGPATLDEVARVVTGSPDAALQRHLLEGAVQRAGRYLMRTDGTVVPAPQARAAVMEALAKTDWGARPAGPVVDWSLQFLESGGLETVNEDLRKLILQRVKPGIDASHTQRLEELLNQRSGADGAAAYVLLRGIAGEPLDAPLTAKTAEEGRQWLAARKKNPK